MRSLLAERRQATALALWVVLAGCGGSGSSSDSALSLSPATLSFSVVENDYIGTASQSARVSVSHKEAAVVAAGYPAGTTPPTWLSLQLYGSGSEWTLSVRPTTTSLPLGTYSATVRVGIARQDQSVIATRDMQVIYTVQPGIAGFLAGDSFTYLLGSGRTPGAQTLRVTGTVGATWTASSSASWVTLSEATGTIPALPKVLVNPAGLGIGDHVATLHFTGAGTTAAVTVFLTVTAPSLTVTPAGTISLGGLGHDASAKQVQLRLSTGATAHAWSVTDAPAWLRVTPSAGTVSDTVASVALRPDPTGLAAGTYGGSATFTATVEGQPFAVSVPVSLALDDHRLLASDGGVYLSSLPGLSRLSRALRIRSNRGLVSSWTASSSAAWLSVTASGTTDEPMVLTADPKDLAADTLHRALVTIASGDPTVVGTETVPVALWVGSTAPVSSSSVATGYGEVAADPMRPYAYVHSRGTGLAVYDVYSGAQVASIAGVGKKLGQMAVSQDGARLFVVDDGAGTVVPVDLETRTVGSAWPVVTPPATGNPSYPVAYARIQGAGVVLAQGSALDAVTGAKLPSPSLGGPYMATSRDGSRFCALDTGYSPYTLLCHALDIGGTPRQVALGPARSVGVFDTGSNGKDVALSEDGSRVYVAAGAPYAFDIFDTAASGSTMAKLGSLPGAAYPVAVEVGVDGRIYCGADLAYGTADAWIYDGAGTLKASFLAGDLVTRGIAVSGDGLRMLALTPAALKFYTVAP